MSSQHTLHHDDSPGLVADCRLMLRYARKNGLSLPDALAGQIAQLDAMLKQCHMQPVSDISSKLIAGTVDFDEQGKPLPKEVAADTEVLVLSIHTALSQVVAPATALTLQVSEPPPNRHTLFGGMPFIVKAAAGVAFVSALFLMGAVGLQATTDDPQTAAGKAASAAVNPTAATAAPGITSPATSVTSPPATAATASSSETTRKQEVKDKIFGLSQQFLWGLSVFAGGALGASFYILLRTQAFLKTRSYDPKYNAAYISRFITGVIAGVILAYTIKQYGGWTNQPNFSPGLLAMLGGYSAEAVEQVLQRLVDILMAAVRGDGKEQAASKAALAQREKLAKIDAATNEILDAQDLQLARAAVLKLKSTLRG